MTAVCLAYRVAIPRQRLRCRNAFSTRCRRLYSSWSYGLGVSLFFLGGITAIRPRIDDRLAVIAVIGNQMRGRDPLHQPARWRAICHGPLRDNDSERHTLRIHGQRSLGVEPPVVRLIS